MADPRNWQQNSMLWSPPHAGVIFMAEVVTAETMGGLITLRDEPMQSNRAPPAATHPLPPPPREAADAPQIFSFGRSEGCQRAPVSCSSRRVLLHGVYCARCARFHQAAPARAEFLLSFFFFFFSYNFMFHTPARRS